MDYGDTLIPLARLSDVDGSGAPGASTDYLTTGLGTSRWPYLYRLTITVALSAAAKFGVTVDGGSPLWFNAGTAINAGAVYTFSMSARPDETYNFQHDQNVTVDAFYVEGVGGGF